MGNKQAELMDKLTNRKTKEVEKQLAKYYAAAAKRVIKDFELTYLKVLESIGKDKTPTPADLYKLDKYWEMQGELRKELQKLGEKEVVLLTEEFEKHFYEVYDGLAIKGLDAYKTIDKAGVQQLINQIWLADGKHYSQRVWKNLERLTQTLNDELIHIVATGKQSRELKQLLETRFGVSFSQADTLVRTELAHIQTVAAKQRYEDYGLKKYKILGNEDDTCGNHKGVDCHELDGKEFYYAEMKVGVNAPPFHPNCRCCIVPIVD